MQLVCPLFLPPSSTCYLNYLTWYESIWLDPFLVVLGNPFHIVKSTQRHRYNLSIGRDWDKKIREDWRIMKLEDVATRRTTRRDWRGNKSPNTTRFMAYLSWRRLWCMGNQSKKLLRSQDLWHFVLKEDSIDPNGLKTLTMFKKYIRKVVSLSLAHESID